MLDVSAIGAMLAGLLSFLSPCILPMVPFYLSYLAGTGMGQVTSGEVRVRAVIPAICFAAGVITVFVGLGASATLLGQVLRDWFEVLRWAAAALILGMGLHFLGIWRIGVLYRQFRADISAPGLLGAYVVGLAFAFGWTPCVGPVLATILFTAAGQDTAGQGAWLLFFYGIGMTAPFVLAALFVSPFLRWMMRFRPWLGLVEKLMGGLLIVFALLIATNRMSDIANWMLARMPWFLTFG